jgi:hypothetical protein
MNYVAEHPEFFWVIFTGVISFSFGCGLTYFMIKETRRNVNGLGGKVTKVILYIIANEDDRDKRIRMVEFFK